MITANTSGRLVEPELRDPFAGAKFDGPLTTRAARLAHPPELRPPACWVEFRTPERELLGGLALAVQSEHPVAAPVGLVSRLWERLHTLAGTPGRGRPSGRPSPSDSVRIRPSTEALSSSSSSDCASAASTSRTRARSRADE
jgi:hypothetical protein